MLEGSEGLAVLAKKVRPPRLKSRSSTPKAACTRAAVPLALTKRFCGPTPVTVRPRDARNALTAAASAAVGECAAFSASALDHRWKLAEAGSSCAWTFCCSKPLSCIRSQAVMFKTFEALVAPRSTAREATFAARAERAFSGPPDAGTATSRETSAMAERPMKLTCMCDSSPPTGIREKRRVVPLHSQLRREP